MEKYLSLLHSNPLFTGIAPTDLLNMLNCVDAQFKSYKKDNIILLAGDPPSFIGIVITGQVKICKEDAEGNESIISELSANDIFAEVFVCANISYMPVNVIALQDTAILQLNYQRIVNTCSNSCAFHGVLITNMLKLIAKKNIILTQKMEVLAKRSTREKIWSYLNICRQSQQSPSIIIPYNRNQLADYLCVDRSALSRELSRMRDDGILAFHKNHFELLV